MPETDAQICLDSIIFGLQAHGGISNYWARLLDGCAEVPPGEICLVLPRKVRFREFSPNWLDTFQTKAEPIPSAVSRYLRCANPRDARVMHTSYYRLPQHRVSRYIVSAYDFIYERYRRGLSCWVHKTQKRAALQRADVIVCISDFTRDDLLAHYPEIDPSRLEVVPLAIDHRTFYPDRVERDHSLSNTVLFVGMRTDYKRFDLAVGALAQSERLRLGVIGPALLESERAALASALPGRWTFFGNVSKVRLRQMYSSAYALVYPSDCEGFGLPLLEAMACACPVVASREGSLPEVGGAAAQYAAKQRADDYAAALASLESAALRQTMTTAGLARAASYSWADTIRLTRHLYRC